MGTQIDDNLAVYATCISNAFLDKYMADANGDYIKVYLYLLRHKGEKFIPHKAADALNLTDNDVERAIRYWEKQGVYSDVSGSFAREDAEVAFTQETPELIWGRRAEDARTAGEQQTEKAKPERRPQSALAAVEDDEEFAGVLFVAKHLLPNLLTRRQVESLEFMYHELGMNAELIEFLLEYCAGLEKTSSKYMERVAIDWHEQGITSVREAKKMIRVFEARKTAPKKSSQPNRFHNFEMDESVDYDAIARSRVRDRMQNGVE